jgi:hypothetical protein
MLPKEDMNTSPAFVFDIDGTLALRVERGPFEWRRVQEDEGNSPVVAVARALNLSGVKIVYVSGRPEGIRLATEQWIREHVGVVGPLFMRPDHDNRSDVEIKREIYLHKIYPNFEVLGVFDDRSSVVKLWRDELGLMCFQVADGNF